MDFALVLIELGERERADELLAACHETMKAMQRLGGDGYWIADVKAYALQGRTALALEALANAVDEGWRIQAWYHLQFDPNLDSIRDEPEFQRLRGVVRRDIEEQAGRLRTLRASGALPAIPPLDRGMH